jgi:hypothetical protein
MQEKLGLFVTTRGDGIAACRERGGGVVLACPLQSLQQQFAFETNPAGVASDLCLATVGLCLRLGFWLCLRLGFWPGRKLNLDRCGLWLGVCCLLRLPSRKRARVRIGCR